MKHIILLIMGALLISNSIAQEDKKKDRRSEKMEMMTVWKLTEHLKLTENRERNFSLVFGVIVKSWKRFTRNRDN